MSAAKRMARTFESAVLGEAIADMARDDERWRFFESTGLYRSTEYQGRQFEEIQKAVIALRDRPQLAAVPDADERFKLLTLEDLDNLPDREYLIDGWMSDGLNVDVGEPGSYKSFVAFDQALCVAAGIPWQDCALKKQGPVVYIAGEGAYGMKQRRDAWLHANGVPAVPDFHIIAEAPHLLAMDDVEAVAVQIRRLDKSPVVVIVDTLARTIIGGDENTARDMGAYVANVDRLRNEFGAAVKIIHHTGWDGERERGSIALRGAADFTVHIKADGHNVTLTNRKNKDGPLSDDLELHAVEVLDSCVLSLGSNQSGLSANERQILQSLPDAFGSDPAPASKLQAAAAVPERSYYRALQSLCKRGLLDVKKEGRSNLYSITPKGEAALLPTTANNCQTSAITTAASHPPFRGGSGSHRGSDSDSEQPATAAEDAEAERLAAKFGEAVA
ncbi:MAG: AAA family ATPase [Actinobacteria bacterium]|nr:AAA family ATPase [Actinomycetota bacterium]